MAGQSTAAAPAQTPLAEAIAGAPSGHVLRTGFPLWLTRPPIGGDCGGPAVARGEVGERTITVELPDGVHRLARIADILVHPADLEWVSRRRDAVGSFNGAAKDPYAPVAEELARQRTLSDERARRDQAGPGRPVGEHRSRRAGQRASNGSGRPAAGGASVAAAATEPGAEEPAAALAEPRPADEAAVVTEVETGPQAACSRCGGQLARHNGKGICTACQAICPRCDGPKAVQADICRACARRSGGPVSSALRLAWSLDSIPAQVQELLDTVMVLARYAHELEDEVGRYRAVERLAQRLGRQALVAASGGPAAREKG